MIEHAPLKSNSSNEGSHVELGNRERSATEDSQVRPTRRRTGSSGDIDLPHGLDESRGGGGGDGPALTFGGNAVAALRSAMLPRHDSAGPRDTAGSSVTNSSRVFRTVSTASSPRINPDTVDAAAVQSFDKRPTSTVEHLHAKAGAMARRLNLGGGSGGRGSSATVDMSLRAARSAQAAQVTLNKLEEKKRKAGGGGGEGDGKGSFGMQRDRTDERTKQHHRFADARAHSKARARTDVKGQTEVKGKVITKGNAEGASFADARQETTPLPPPPPPPPVVAAPAVDSTISDKPATSRVSAAEQSEELVQGSRDGRAKGTAVAKSATVVAQAATEAKARAVAGAKSAAAAQARRQKAEEDAAAAEKRRQKLAAVHAAEERRRTLGEGDRERERARLLKRTETDAAKKARDLKDRMKMERRPKVVTSNAATAATASPVLATGKQEERVACMDKEQRDMKAAGAGAGAAVPDKKQQNGFAKKGNKGRQQPPSSVSSPSGIWGAPTAPPESSTATQQSADSSSGRSVPTINKARESVQQSSSGRSASSTASKVREAAGPYLSSRDASSTANKSRESVEASSSFRSAPSSTTSNKAREPVDLSSSGRNIPGVRKAHARTAAPPMEPSAATGSVPAPTKAGSSNAAAPGTGSAAGSNGIASSVTKRPLGGSVSKQRQSYTPPKKTSGVDAVNRPPPPSYTPPQPTSAAQKKSLKCTAADPMMSTIPTTPVASGPTDEDSTAATTTAAVVTNSFTTAATTTTKLTDKDQPPDIDIPYASVVSADTDVAMTLDAAPTPLSQHERDENVLRAHLASWRFCFHEAAALLTPVLGVGNVETPNGGVCETVGREVKVDLGTASTGPGLAATGFLVAPSEEIDLQSEVNTGLTSREAKPLIVFFMYIMRFSSRSR